MFMHVLLLCLQILSVFVYKSSTQNTADLLVSRNLRVYMYSMEHQSNNTLWPHFFGQNHNNIPVHSGVGHADGKG